MAHPSPDQQSLSNRTFFEPVISADSSVGEQSTLPVMTHVVLTKVYFCYHLMGLVWSSG